MFFCAFKEEFTLDLKREEEGKPTVLPDNLGDVLMDFCYRDYIGSNGRLCPGRESDYKIFKWFVTNILCSVNCELTTGLSKQVEKMGHPDFVSRTFTASDEAFAILVVVNYEKRWRNQVLHPTKDRKKLRDDEIYRTKFTSSKRGFSKLPWDEEGIKLYNDTMKKIEGARGNKQTGVLLESWLKNDLENSKQKKKNNRRVIVETQPVIGGALQQRLAALKYISNKN